MGYSTLIYLLVLFLTTFSCGSSGEKEGQKNNPDSVKQSITSQDSMPEVTPPRPDLPPNSIRIKGKLLKIHTSRNDEIASIELRILQILGVGSATPVVAPHDTLRIKTFTLPGTLSEGIELIGVISHHQIISQEENEATPWQLGHIENERDHD